MDDEVARDEDALGGEVDDDVAAGVAAPEVEDVYAARAAVEREPVQKRDRGEDDRGRGVLGHVALGDADVAGERGALLFVERAARDALVLLKSVFERGDEGRVAAF